MISWPTPNIGFKDWADSLRLTRPDIEINPIIKDEKKWKEWVNSMIQSQICQTNNSPRADGFRDWKNWAYAFIRSFAQNT